MSSRAAGSATEQFSPSRRRQIEANIGRILPFRTHNGQGITRLGIADGLRLTLQFYDPASALERDRRLREKPAEQIQPAKTRSTGQHVTVWPSCFRCCAANRARSTLRSALRLYG